MSETLTMSKKELQRVKTVHAVASGLMGQAEGARVLQLSARQMFRIMARFSEDGDAGLVHKLRGKSSNHRGNAAVREQVLTLYRTGYADYGPAFFCETLARRHGIDLRPETARRWLRTAGLWTARTRKHPHRQRRPRRAAIGELVQFDGSPHDWFEGRGPACTLLHAIDDASGRIFLRFAESENTADVMRAMWDYIKRYGIPKALYVDYGSVYKDGDTPTQFERAMTVLGVEIIHAHSPQAKGRVERGNRTHQDRAIKRMREENICTIAAANAFLDRTYHDEHNARFACVDGLPDVHADAARFDLERIFCLEEPRVVNNDYTVQFDGVFYQLERSETPLPPPRTRIIARRFLDNTMHFYWNEQPLAFSPIAARPRRPKRTPVPKPDHAFIRRNANLRRTTNLRRTSRDTIMRPP